MEEDDDFFDEDEEVSLDYAAATSDEESALSDLLLELTINIVRLRMLMEEAEEGEFKAVFRRLASFHAEVARLPKSPALKEPMGFKAPKKKRSKD